MKNTILIIQLFITTFCLAQPEIKVYYEQIDNGYTIYADNNEFCPITIKMDFILTNLNHDNDNKTYVVDARTKKQLLTTLKASKQGKAYKFTYNYLTNYGNHSNDRHDENYIYSLPFRKSNSFIVSQGYDGTVTHQNQNALDFKMPIGTELTAIREGTVIKVIEKNNTNCIEKECEKFNNLIMIFHSDGTFAEYAHIKQNGSKVKVGDKVSKGQLIGYSGNVGRSDGPHLHLVIFKQKMKERVTLKTKFQIGNGDKTEYLIEKTEYLRDY